MPTARPRLALLDALRGAAVMAMIHQHVGIWLWRGPDADKTNLDYPGLVALNVAVVVGAPLFFALSGLGTGMLARSPARPGIDALLVRRGAGLLGFGLLVNLATPSWFSWGSFFALHLMGASIALTPVWRRLSDRVLLGLVFAVFAATPFVQAWLELPSELTSTEMRDVSGPLGVLRIGLAGGQYPMLPWSATFLAGMWAGRIIDAGRIRPMIVLGVVLVVTGGLGHLALVLSGAAEPSVLWRAFRFKIGWFPAPLSIVMPLLGAVMFILAGAIARERTRPLRPDHVLACLGRMSLTVFIVHAPLFRELSRPVGAWSALEPGATLAVIAAFTVLCLAAARLWSRVDYRYGAEWLLRRLDGSAARSPSKPRAAPPARPS